MQVCTVHAAELEEREGELEEEESERRSEEENEKGTNKEEETELMKEVHAETTCDNVPCHELQQFDWVMDNNTLIGPVPNTSDFRCTKPPSPLVSPKPATRLPDCPPQLVCELPKPTVTQPNGDMAPSTPTSCTPTTYTAAGPIHSMQASTVPVEPVPIKPDKPAPWLPDIPIMPSQPVCMLPKPTITPSKGDVAPSMCTPQWVCPAHTTPLSLCPSTLSPVT